MSDPRGGHRTRAGCPLQYHRLVVSPGFVFSVMTVILIAAAALLLISLRALDETRRILEGTSALIDDSIPG